MGQQAPDFNQSEVLVGRPARVTVVEPDGRTFHAQLHGGGAARVSSELCVSVQPGDTLLVSELGWHSVPREVWLEENSIGIVRKITKHRIVLETSIGLRVIPRAARKGLKFRTGYTVEFDNHVGIIRVIAKSPIRTRDEGVEENVIKAYRVDSSPSEMLSFASFGGYHSVRERAVELIETQLERRDLLATIGARPIKGIIFSGPPGTGKTHLARIIAHESGAAFYLVSGPSIVSKWVGDSEDTLRRIFADAASEAKAIVFFDEIDSIAESRTGESHESSKRLVAQLLTLLDGFDREGSNVVVLAATNRIDDVDDALLRPGRFDWEIPFGLPTFEDRLEILQVSSRNLRTDQALPLDEIARLTEGWPPARLTSIWTEAALVAAGDGRPQIADEDLLIALERVSNRPARTRGVEEA